MNQKKPSEIDEARLFEIVCKHKDAAASDLNKVFASYGTSTLEAKTPIIEEKDLKKIKLAPGDQELYVSLALKSQSAQDAMAGRRARIRNKNLTTEMINGEPVLVAGVERERSPVDESQLDDDIESYMKERARLKAVAATVKLEEVEKSAPPVLPATTPDSDDPLETVDIEFDHYMEEAKRRKAQKKLMEEQSERANIMEAMEAMEADRDYDTDGQEDPDALIY